MSQMMYCPDCSKMTVHSVNGATEACERCGSRTDVDDFGPTL